MHTSVHILKEPSWSWSYAISAYHH